MNFDQSVQQMNSRLPQAEFVGGPLDGYRIGMSETDLKFGWTTPAASGKQHVYARRGHTWILEYKGEK